MYKFKILGVAVLLLSLQSCKKEEGNVTIHVKNDLDIERTFETITLSKEQLNVSELTDIGVKDSETNELQVTQMVDNDGDGIMDDLLFQPKLQPNSEREYQVVKVTNERRPKAPEYCYSRFVPERTDDYTWENDKVAFRVYGPTAQKMNENGNPAGTLSSGVDAWFKKVNYPIIDKWYKKDLGKTGSYHKDTGEGMDAYHVGPSRGVGGIAVKRDSTYYVSKNYTNYRTITTGPIRTSFFVEYANWNADGDEIKESHIISLDLGNNLSKFEISIEGTQDISAGLTLHDNKGEITENNKNGWVSYWEKYGDSYVGTAIVGTSNYFTDFVVYKTEQVDLSNVYANLKVKDGKVVYFAGFGWTGSKQFNTKKEWEDYLSKFSRKVNNPLIVTIK
ncbi:DUF4861 family protein [Flavobacterium fluviatile]|uniref:DUF4861 family protein n=1 Tax=Flavobacterium fluviatile TaxID=1862387 RepID=UPI0013D2AC3A|nr:DUF4861 family protein [Flavobacterium fluviatile]